MSASSSPAKKGVAVTPSDSVNLPGGTCRALWVGNGGDVSLMFAGPDAVAVVHKNVASGSVLPAEACRVMSTGTSATDIVAWY